MGTRKRRSGRTLALSPVRISNWLLETLNGSRIGIALYDKRFRYVGVNSAIAAMNGVPPEEHVGRVPADVIGGASRIIEPQIDRVFQTGQPVYRHEFSAQLRRRRDTGHWIQDYFPVKDERNRVNQVGISVVEITQEMRLGAIIRHLRQLISADIVIEDEKNLRTLNRAAEPQDTVTSPRLAPKIIFDTPSAMVSPADVLSARELEVLTLLAQGKSNKEAASILTISEKTVATHRSSIKLKLRLNSLVELTHYAIRHGIVEP
jgi:DNA-binding CsgD family transcriptional regulator